MTSETNGSVKNAIDLTINTKKEWQNGNINHLIDRHGYKISQILNIIKTKGGYQENHIN